MFVIVKSETVKLKSSITRTQASSAVRKMYCCWEKKREQSSGNFSPSSHEQQGTERGVHTHLPPSSGRPGPGRLGPCPRGPCRVFPTLVSPVRAPAGAPGPRDRPNHPGRLPPPPAAAENINQRLVRGSIRTRTRADARASSS